jgi:hypothetical protein
LAKYKKKVGNRPMECDDLVKQICLWNIKRATWLLLAVCNKIWEKRAEQKWKLFSLQQNFEEIQRSQKLQLFLIPDISQWQKISKLRRGSRAKIKFRRGTIIYAKASRRFKVMPCRIFQM